MDYLELASSVISRAKKKGADQCDCMIEVGSELSIKVRQGAVESIERASFRGLGIRFFVKKALGFGFTTDFSTDSINHLITSARDFAQTSTPDPEAGIPDFEHADAPELEINDPRIDGHFHVMNHEDWKVVNAAADMVLRRTGGSRRR